MSTLPDFLSTTPLAWGDKRIQLLHWYLCQSYWNQDSIRNLTTAAGISPAYINWEQDASSIWHDALNTAASMLKLDALITQVDIDPHTLEHHLDDLPS